MSTEELLNIRFKLIAGYPGCEIEVGSIIHMGSDYEQQVGYLTLIAYPHLFQKLEWWQERKPEEMPEYVKHSGGEVIRVDGWEKDNEERSHGVIISNEFKIHNTRHISWFLPATLEEYNQYQSSIKHL